MRWAGHVLGTRRSAYRALVGKPGGKRPLGEPRHRWQALIEVLMNLRVP